jgi:hypothetical protein
METKKILLIGAAVISASAIATATYAYSTGKFAIRSFERPRTTWSQEAPAGISNLPKSDLSEAEKSLLPSAYQEEKMAHDTYLKAAAAFPSAELDNIIASEAQHMESVKTLLDRYGIPIPEGYGKYETLFSTLSAKAVKSQADAINVGIAIEITDINDIVSEIKTADNEDIRTVLSRIGGASFNHLRSFVRMAQSAGVTPETPYSDYLSESDLSSRGSLSYKMTELLKKEGVILSGSASFGGGRGGQREGKGFGGGERGGQRNR